MMPIRPYCIIPRIDFGRVTIFSFVTWAYKLALVVTELLQTLQYCTVLVIGGVRMLYHYPWPF
jgi:hypothetical protein